MSNDWNPPGCYLYFRDFVSDGKVEVMTTEMIGAYFLLIGKAWFERPPCTIPDDDEVLAAWTRLPIDRWRLIRPKTLAPWTKIGKGRFIQKRLKHEWQSQLGKHMAASESGKLGNAKRWEGNRKAIAARSGGDPSPIASPCLSPSLVLSPSTPTKTEEEKEENGSRPVESGGGTTAWTNGKRQENQRPLGMFPKKKGYGLLTQTMTKYYWKFYLGPCSYLTVADEIDAEIRRGADAGKIMDFIRGNEWDQGKHPARVLRGAEIPRKAIK